MANVSRRTRRSSTGGEPSTPGNLRGSPGCLVEEVVNAALSKSFDDAEALLLARFGEVTLAMLAANVRRRAAARKGSHHRPDKAHG
jgi:hypothetical protein